MLVIAPERFKEAFQAAVITSEPQMLEGWTDWKDMGNYYSVKADLDEKTRDGK